MKKLMLTGISAIAGVVALSSVAIAEPASSQKHAEAAVTYREAIFQLIRSNMAPLGGMAKGALPMDESVLMTNGMRLEQLANMLGDYMSVDTREFDVHTEAKDAIWENPEDFAKKIEALRSAAVALQATVEAGDDSEYRAAIGKVGASCKSCHDSYKD